MDSISTLSDKFSWHRAAAISLFYKKQLTWYTIGAGCISLLCYLLVQLTNQFGGNTMDIYAMTSFIVGGTLYLSPLMFIRQNDTLMTLLPANASEKFVFYSVVCLLIIPAVILLTWYVTNFIFICIDPNMDICELIFAKFANYSIDLESIDSDMKAMRIPASITQTFAIVMTVLFSVLYFKNHRALYGILLAIAVVLVFSILSGIAAVVIVISNPEITTKLTPEELPLWMMPKMMPFIWCMYGILTIYGLFMARKVYLLLSCRQIGS